MVDGNGNTLIDSAKTIECVGGADTINLRRDVYFEGPLHCEGSAVPPVGPQNATTGVITATADYGAGTYVEELDIKCAE